MALGANGVRLLEKDTEDEVGRYNFKDIRNFSYNTTFNYFQFTTCLNSVNTETYTFKSKQCQLMFEQVKHLLAQNLRQNNINDPEELLTRATHQVTNDKKKNGAKTRSHRGRKPR